MISTSGLVPDLAATAELTKHLLVVTPAGVSGIYGLELPFQDATVIETDTAGKLDLTAVRQPVDAVVVETPAGTPGWALRVAAAVGHGVSDNARLFIVFRPDLAAEAVPTVENTDPRDPPNESTFSDAFRGRQVVSIGLVDDAVCVALGHQVDATRSGQEHSGAAAMTVTTVGQTVHLAAIARTRRPPASDDGKVARTQAGLGPLRSEVRQLSTALESERRERELAERRYHALQHSHLGRLTLRYWQLRRRLAARRRR